MIRNEMRRFRETLSNMPSSERTGYATLIFTSVIFFGGLIYYFAPIDITLKHFFFALVTVVVFGLAVIGYMHERSSPRPQNPKQSIPPKPSSPPTTAIQTKSIETVTMKRIQEDTSNTPPPKRRGRRRETFNELVNEGGSTWLVVHTYTPIPQGAFKKKLWRHKAQRLELDNSRHVNIKLATKIPLLPTNGEEKIYCLLRLHWWSHGPAQIGVIAITLLTIALVALAGLNTPDTNGYTGTLSVVCLLAIAGGIWYYIVWMQWGYSYLVITNLKIRLLYFPPFNLPADTPETELALLEGGLNPKADFWGRLWGYGTIKTETIARTVDSWLVERVNFVPHYRQVAALLSQLREDAVKQLNS